ncbi:MAG: Bug family tripartite tricarboxylate transporter substrate binding protein [Burkholderiales bacterium]
MMKRASVIAFSFTFASVAATSLAQTFPSKTVRLISGTTPGSATDTVARAIADRMQANLGQSVIVENRLGAGGLIATTSIAKGEPDGHTILIHAAAYTVSTLISPLQFDPHKDITPVAAIAVMPTTIVTSPAKGFKTLQELVAAAKAKPGSFNATTAGVGSSTHMNAERFRFSAGIDVVHIHFKGTPEALTEVLTGRADYFFAPTFGIMPHLKDGKLVALAMGSQRRSKLLPDVPTSAELGYANSDYHFWIGGLVSGKTPPALVERLHAEINKAVQSPDVQERFEKLGVEPLTMSMAEFQSMIAKELEDNAKLIKAAGIKAN